MATAKRLYGIQIVLFPWQKVEDPENIIKVTNKSSIFDLVHNLLSYEKKIFKPPQSTQIFSRNIAEKVKDVEKST